MYNFIARANIDHCIELLGRDDIQPSQRSIICKLLIEEENKLSHDLEQLQFAESRVSRYRDRVDRLRRLRDRFADGSTERIKIEGVLLDCESLLGQVEAFCIDLRRRVNERAL